MPNLNNLTAVKNVDAQTIIIEGCKNDEEKSLVTDKLDYVINRVKNLYEEGKPNKMYIFDDFHAKFRHFRIPITYIIQNGVNNAILVSFIINNNETLFPAWLDIVEKTGNQQLDNRIAEHMEKHIRKTHLSNLAPTMATPMTEAEIASALRRFIADAHSAINQVLRHLSQDDDATNSIS